MSKCYFSSWYTQVPIHFCLSEDDTEIPPLKTHCQTHQELLQSDTTIDRFGTQLMASANARGERFKERPFAKERPTAPLPTQPSHRREIVEDGRFWGKSGDEVDWRRLLFEYAFPMDQHSHLIVSITDAFMK